MQFSINLSPASPAELEAFLAVIKNFNDSNPALAPSLQRVNSTKPGKAGPLEQKYRDETKTAPRPGIEYGPLREEHFAALLANHLAGGALPVAPVPFDLPDSEEEDDDGNGF